MVLRPKTKMLIGALLAVFAFGLRAEERPSHLHDLTSGGFKFETLDSTNARDFDFDRAGERQPFMDATGNPAFDVQDFPNGIAEVLDAIQAERGRIVLDSALFVQVAAIYERAEEQKSSTLIPFATPQMELAPFFLDADFANVGLQNTESHQRLQFTPFRHRSQWLFPVGADKFIGLSTSGVAILPGAAWLTATREGLASEINRLCERELTVLEPPMPEFINPEAQAETRHLLIRLKRAGRSTQWTIRSVNRSR